MGVGLDFYRRWAEGMGGDEEEAMLQLLAVAEAAKVCLDADWVYSPATDSPLSRLRAAMAAVEASA